MDKRGVTNEIQLDFSPLLVQGKRFAVYCETEEEATIFLRCLREKYPQRCQTWEPGETHFDAYDQICYRPNLNMHESYTLKYCSYRYYRDEGFIVIPFADLIANDIEESEQPLDFLLN